MSREQKRKSFFQRKKLIHLCQSLRTGYVRIWRELQQVKPISKILVCFICPSPESLVPFSISIIKTVVMEKIFWKLEQSKSLVAL